jgi:membrane protein implicated in regulation of membrane protease activity
MSVRETYGLPRRPPAFARFAAFMLAFAGAALLLWLVLPDGPVTVAVLAILLLAAVGVGVSRIFTAREVTEPPPHRPGPSRATD